MIGFNHLGKIGRLGNQMFQVSGLLGIAENLKYDYCIPDHSKYSDYGGYQHHELQACFKLPHFDGKYGCVDGDLVELEQYHFCQELMDECPDNVTLVGYFESEKYFKHCEKKVRENFQFKDEIVDKCLKYGEKILEKNPVAIVVRRGDFLSPHNINRHPVCDINYYERSLEFFKDRNILIFSDEKRLQKSNKLDCFVKVDISNNPNFFRDYLTI